MIRHASAGKIAMFLAGELRPRQAARIQAHLARCARCAQTSAGLAAVTTLLAGAKAPPIPEHLSARIHSALAAEAAQRIIPAAAAKADGHASPAAVPDEVHAVPAGGQTAAPPVGRPARERRARQVRGPRLAGLATATRLRVAVAAGAVILVGGGGYALVSQLSPGTTGPASSASAPRAAPPSRLPAAGSGAAHAAVLGPREAGPALGYRRGGRRATFTPIASSTNYRPGRLAAQVNMTISAAHGQASFKGGSSGNANQPTATGEFAGLRVAQLRACVGKIAAGNTVVLVDVARFRGLPATVIVTEPARAGRMGILIRQIYVVGPACSATRLHVLDHVSVPAD
jgi:Putative zinc-finger